MIRIMKNQFKNSFIIVMIITIPFIVFGQAPQKFDYQAILRDNSGEVIQNRSVSLVISILDSSSTGTTLYKEGHSISTNGFGLVTIEIGNGNVITGDFEAIPWGKNSKYVKVEMDPNNGTNYKLLGVSQLVSVPYALYSANSGNTYTAGFGIAINGLVISNTAPGILSYTQSQIDALTPYAGLTVFNSTTTYLNFYDGSNWYEIPKGTCIPQPTIAKAGADQYVIINHTNLAANTPTIGVGHWTIISGAGGTITDSTSPTSSFYGNLGDSYTLEWIITTSCTSSADQVIINFQSSPVGDPKD
jgi:hypothetical protein